MHEKAFQIFLKINYRFSAFVFAQKLCEKLKQSKKNQSPGELITCIACDH